MFKGSNNVVVTGGQFINAGSQSTLDPVSTTLWSRIAPGATFDSAERYPPGRCHPGTRQRIIQQITDWANDHNPAQHILWLHGPAGSGKSALVQTICELLRESNPERYGGSFFFARGSTDRGNAHKLFSTLSYQLALQSPSMRTEVNNALSRDPSLPIKSMEFQLHSLIIEPLLRCQSHRFTSHSPTIVIDGLDECVDNDNLNTQCNILTLIANSIVEHQIPLRFIITSRPEYWIREAFDISSLPSITLPLSLREDVAANNDIKTYITDEFEKIRLENKRFMGSVITPWPPADIVDRFVYEASGQYIYASAILYFVGKSPRFRDPQEKLRIITSPGPHRALAFYELDRLYATILFNYPQWERMKLVLGGLLVGANPTIIEVVFGVDREELVPVLGALSSLIDIKKPKPLSQNEWLLESTSGSMLAGRDKISFCHRSFPEFLEDETRSGTYYIDVDKVRSEIVRAFFTMIHRNLEQNYEMEPHFFLSIDLATYHGIMNNVTFQSIWHCKIDTVFPLIIQMTERLLLLDFSKPINFLSCFMHDMDVLKSLFDFSFYNDQRHNLLREDPEKLHEFRTACEKLKDAISRARTRAICVFPVYNEIKITPTLVYLTEYVPSWSASVDELCTILGTVDVMFTIREHRQITHLAYLHGQESWSLYCLNLNALFDTGEEPSWRTQGQWRDLRILFALQCLNSFLNGDESYSYDSDQCRSLKNFFNSRNTSDILSKEYFQNTCSMSLLALMTNLSAWTSLLHKGGIVRSLMVSVLCWFNRQLTNQQTLKLLQDYDKSLQQRMTMTMNHIFEDAFLPGFANSSKKLCVFGSVDLDTKNASSITMKVLPLPQGFHQEQDSFSAYKYLDSDDWRPFHDEVFGKTATNTEGHTNSIIDPSHWYPYLLSHLLNALVKFLYGRIYTKFSHTFDEDVFEGSFPYIIQCLPYAEPSPENLEALRAIVYLYPQVNPPWSPPEGFWLLIVEFLQKYDCSVLSSEEHDLFEAWLTSTDHGDIKTCINL